MHLDCFDVVFLWELLSFDAFEEVALELERLVNLLVVDDVFDAKLCTTQKLLKHILLGVVNDNGNVKVGKFGKFTGLLDQVLLPLALDVLNSLPASVLLIVVHICITAANITCDLFRHFYQTFQPFKL